MWPSLPHHTIHLARRYAGRSVTHGSHTSWGDRTHIITNNNINNVININIIGAALIMHMIYSPHHHERSPHPRTIPVKLTRVQATGRTQSRRTQCVLERLTWYKSNPIWHRHQTNKNKNPNSKRNQYTSPSIEFGARTEDRRIEHWLTVIIIFGHIYPTTTTSTTCLAALSSGEQGVK